MNNPNNPWAAEAGFAEHPDGLHEVRIVQMIMDTDKSGQRFWDLQLDLNGTVVGYRVTPDAANDYAGKVNRDLIRSLYYACGAQAAPKDFMAPALGQPLRNKKVFALIGKRKVGDKTFRNVAAFWGADASRPDRFKSYFNPDDTRYVFPQEVPTYDDFEHPVGSTSKGIDLNEDVPF